MTLALTIVSRHGIWQCSDMRLFDVNMGRRRPDGSVKQFRLDVQDGVALVTYAGIGQIGTAHVSDLMLDLLRGDMRTLDQTLSALVTFSNQYIAPLIPQLPPMYRMHTFVLGAFREGRPLLCEVRNVDVVKQTVRHTYLRLRRDFTASVTVVGDRDGIASIAGVRRWVPPPYRDLLHRIRATKPRRHEDRLALLATVNLETSRRVPDWVSPECWTWHVTGHHEQQTEQPRAFSWGAPIPSRSTPQYLLSGLDLSAWTRAMSDLLSTGDRPGTPGFHDRFVAANEAGMRQAIRLRMGHRVLNIATGEIGRVEVDPVPGGHVNDIGIRWDSNPAVVDIVHRGRVMVDT